MGTCSFCVRGLVAMAGDAARDLTALARHKYVSPSQLADVRLLTYRNTTNAKAFEFRLICALTLFENSRPPMQKAPSTMII